MTETTKEIFEKYEVRKTKKQKSDFIEYVKAVAEKEGYSSRIERGALGARNIVVGDSDSAMVVYTAHYDTCPRLPFPNFITPKKISVYILYQLAVVFLFMLLPSFAVSFGVGFVLTVSGAHPLLAEALASIAGELTLVLLLVLMFVGPANKHTANDNTSGVTTLLDIMTALPEDLRDDAAFIFFDLEEVGLFGSAGYASKHKAAMKDKLLVNFDCVSDGETVIFALRGGAKKYESRISEAFKSKEGITAEVLTKGVFYPSDQVNFPCGVGVAALRKSKRGILYMNRIHTPKDTVYREENIKYLTDGAVRLTEIMAKE